jgi:hypothetical protein
MGIFRKKNIDKGEVDEKIQERRAEAYESIKKFENLSVFNGDGEVVETYDRDFLSLDFTHVNNGSIILSDPDLFNFSIWLATALDPFWWDSNIDTKAKVLWRFTTDKMHFQEKYHISEFDSLNKSLTNLMGAVTATLQASDDFGDVIMHMGENAIVWSKE